MIDVARERVVAAHKQTTAESLYDYVTSSTFNQNVERIVGIYLEMKAQIAKEEASASRGYKQRNMQVDMLLSGMTGIYGEMQGIARHIAPANCATGNRSMKIAVIILHYGKLDTTKTCLKELKSKISDHQVILINNTQDDITELIKIIPGTKLVNNPQNLGFAAGVNQGISLDSKDKTITHYFLMNNDLSISFGSLAQLLLTFNRFPAAGIVSPVLHHGGGYDWGGKYNKWTGMVKHKNWGNKPKTTQTVAHVAGAAMLISRELIDKIGMFDERFFSLF